jgi:hypothetical protein
LIVFRSLGLTSSTLLLQHAFSLHLPVLSVMAYFWSLAFNARSPLRPRRVMWLRLLGCIVFVATVLEAFSYLSQHPETSPFRVLSPFNHRHPILRPGQYRETSGHQYVLGTPAEDIVEQVDDMGIVHDRR